MSFTLQCNIESYDHAQQLLSDGYEYLVRDLFYLLNF